jgi:hypothetical protein
MIIFDKDHKNAQPTLEKVPKTEILNTNLSGDIRRLIEDYQVVVILSDNRKFRITVPALFQYDGASIPNIWIIRKIIGGPYSERLLPGGTPHDWMFYTHRAQQWVNEIWTWVSVDFDTANQILRSAILMAGTTSLHAWEVYKAVSWFGSGHWDNDTEDTHYLSILTNQIFSIGKQPEDYGLDAINIVEPWEAVNPVNSGID